MPGFNDVCEDCHSYWHCCVNCALHSPGTHNDCRSSTTEPVADREGTNYCEEFIFRNPDDQPEPVDDKKSPKQAWDDLFS